ncbi:mannitol dehydrogenase family protein [Aestuariibius sp. HNIBRBA575]|uniref:mannitol dehydrogenase family protein n=1 Tax=Aestuariibius sp. HNIBRBA575 TaxID=3233343 RepID=UPI0034A387E2
MQNDLYSTSYDRNACKIGVVHLGYGAFHRAHQAVYLDDYMQVSGDLRWGVAAVNLRAGESNDFATNADVENGYIVKSFAPDGAEKLRQVRAHLSFHDWAVDPVDAENLLCNPDVHMVTLTVTESGYYGDAAGVLDPNAETIKTEIAGGPSRSVYAYLSAALNLRRIQIDQPITILCCDNIQQNGLKLRDNMMSYLSITGQDKLLNWMRNHVTFPCSMVDRITPRLTADMRHQIEADLGPQSAAPIIAEAFSHWVLERNFAGPMPQLDQVGVIVTDDVHPFEEAKIRILNGGHTCLTYLAALKGMDTFDAAMCDPELRAHFTAYETQEVLFGITFDLPFDKSAYLADITARFGNQAIGDTIARICADGMVKFPIFIRPTLRDCLRQGHIPRHGLRSVASWYVFAKHVAAGRIPFKYVEPGWDEIVHLIKDPSMDRFVLSTKLWGDLPETYPEFARTLRASITEVETQWPV